MGENPLIERAITHAAVAGGLRSWARVDARSAAGLTKAADQHTLLAERALTDWTIAARALAGPALAERIIDCK